MKTKIAIGFSGQLLRWTPRILSVLFALFISMFAMDVFGEKQGFWRTAVALSIHLIPTAIIVLIVAVSWRWELVGAIAFPALGICHLAMTWSRLNWPVYLIIEVPLLIIGLLYLADAYYGKNHLSTCEQK